MGLCWYSSVEQQNKMSANFGELDPKKSKLWKQIGCHKEGTTNSQSSHQINEFIDAEFIDNPPLMHIRVSEGDELQCSRDSLGFQFRSKQSSWQISSSKQSLAHFGYMPTLAREYSERDQNTESFQAFQDSLITLGQQGFKQLQHKKLKPVHHDVATLQKELSQLSQKIRNFILLGEQSFSHFQQIIYRLCEQIIDQKSKNKALHKKLQILQITSKQQSCEFALQNKQLLEQIKKKDAELLETHSALNHLKSIETKQTCSRQISQIDSTHSLQIDGNEGEEQTAEMTVRKQTHPDYEFNPTDIYENQVKSQIRNSKTERVNSVPVWQISGEQEHDILDLIDDNSQSAISKTKSGHFRKNAQRKISFMMNKADGKPSNQTARKGHYIHCRDFPQTLKQKHRPLTQHNQSHISGTISHNGDAKMNSYSTKGIYNKLIPDHYSLEREMKQLRYRKYSLNSVIPASTSTSTNCWGKLGSLGDRIKQIKSELETQIKNCTDGAGKNCIDRIAYKKTTDK